jgi:predicted nucleic acid-binding protein
MDASALVKLVITEDESGALREYIGEGATLISSRVGEVELRRVTGRQAERPADAAVDAVLRATSFMELDPLIAGSAGRIGPTTLRSLDAIHLASALALRDELDAFVTYDLRLADAARGAGLRVVSPA